MPNSLSKQDDFDTKGDGDADSLLFSGSSTVADHNEESDAYPIFSSPLRFEDAVSRTTSRRFNSAGLPWTQQSQRKRQQQVFTIMRQCGYVLAILTFTFVIMAIPILTIYAVQEHNVGTDVAAFVSSGAFVILTIPISMYEIFNHLTHWYMPDCQKYVVRILWMVPLYSVQSWLSLRYHQFSLYIDTLRDLYEAFVIQSFLYYLVEILGGEDVLSRALSEKGETRHGEHGKCLGKCIPTWEMGEEFMLQCKHGVLQYVVIKTFATIFAFLLELCGLYGEGTFNTSTGYFYLAAVTNFSQMWALYCLIKLFYATKDELRKPIDWHPVGKFLCVKGVVFFTWWQGVGIYILQAYGIISDANQHWKAADVATGIQDYLVCVEMLFFAMAHTYTFTYKEYITDEDSPFTSADDGGYNSGSEDDADGSYRTPLVRRLSTPMHFSRALWSSTLPTETLSDIYRC